MGGWGRDRGEERKPGKMNFKMERGDGIEGVGYNGKDGEEKRGDMECR